MGFCRLIVLVAEMDFDLSLKFLASRVGGGQKTPLGTPYPILGHICDSVKLSTRDREYTSHENL